ncbi:uncharacterized protein BJX67DRAFT_389649 [Aspergillus lucknowensis]|uniref:Uncharacterized protein n=1 Tax=Aspergillus lucknowensis TaxID=176173 RepID=A0ABR4LK92_9EURO
MSANKSASGRKKDAINFVNARPASESERLNIKRLVRAHVGKWISTQTKDRAADRLRRPLPPFYLRFFDPYLPSTSASSTLSPASSASSRGSPDSCISNSSHTAIPVFTAPPHSLSELSHAVVPPQNLIPSPPTLEICRQCDGHGDGCLCTESLGSDTPSPPYSEDYIEVVGAGSLDPFRIYPSQIEPELIQISEEYCLSCLWPGLTPGPSGTNMQSWFPMSLSDTTLFTAFLYGSLSHMRVQALNGWIPRQIFRTRHQRLLEHVEMETIKLVSREMDDPTRAVCDAMIFSVVCMAHNKAEDDVTGLPRPPFTAPMQRLQWLDVYGSLRPNLVHIGGLIQMVNLRGGIDEIQLPGLASIISFSDIVTSTTFLSRPVFPWVPLEASRRNKTMQEVLGYTDASVDHYFAHFQQLGLPRSLAEILCAINTYTNLVDQAQMGYDPSLLADQRNILHYTLICIPPAASIEHDPNASSTYAPQPQDIIYDSFRLACLIYSVGVVLPLPAQSTPITKLAELLYNTLQVSHHPSIWASPQAQVALLWILTLGGIAAIRTPHRSWYANMLYQVTVHNKITSYDDLKRYLAILAWYPIACDKPGLELWIDVQKARVFRG